jgi:tetratricopeptide (TPR) repeat protein
MMNTKSLLRTMALCLLAGSLLAQSANAAKNTRARPNSAAPKRSARPISVDAQMQKALDLGKGGNYEDASILLYRLLQGPYTPERKMHIRYVLGLMLYELRLDQVASFQFIEVIRDGNSDYVQKSLEKLSLAANSLNNDMLLNFALNKASLEDFPKIYHDMLYFRIGEIQRKRGAAEEALASLRKVRPSSEWYPRARYLLGLTYAEQGKTTEAINAYREIVDHQGDEGVTNPNLVSAQMGIARTLYQAKKWDVAIEAYRQIPRDSASWHDAVFEISWTFMQAAQFRNVLSQLHSLHSPYYEDYYLPESVQLRSLVYLYICQYDEMLKTLNFFDRTYRPIQRKIADLLKTERSAMRFYTELRQSVKSDLELNDSEASSKADGTNHTVIPRNVARTIVREGDLQRSLDYIARLEDEDRRIKRLPSGWRRSSLGTYAEKVVRSRLGNARIVAGRQVQAHLIRVRKELDDLFEQQGFARYELARGKKESVQKEIARKGVERRTVDQDQSREYYVQNGFEYWPFQGEYWLDEIGNYQYVGVSSCE